MGTPQTTKEYVWVTLPLIIILFGLIGNAFSAAVLLRERFRKRSISIYLITLAALDSLYLLNNLPLANATKVLFGVHYMSHSSVVCDLSRYATLASRAASAWVMVVLTVERLLALSIPHHAFRFTSRRRAAVSTAVVVLLLGVICSYKLFLFDINPKLGRCSWKRSVKDAGMDVVSSIFDLLIYTIVPASIMATCNSLLLFLLHYSRELKQRTESDNKNAVVTIICVSVSFIILTSPRCVYSIFYLAGVKLNVPDYLYTVLYSLELLNHAINCVLYGVSGATFRKEVKAMFSRSGCCERLTKARSSISSSGGKTRSSAADSTPETPV